MAAAPTNSPAASIDKRFMNVALPWLLLVGPQPITATRGVNPFFMLQLRCAFRLPLRPITHAPARLAPRERDRLASKTTEMSAFNSRNGKRGNHEGDTPVLSISHDTA